MSFTFNTTPSVHFGCGKISELGNLAVELCSGRVLLVTDPDLMATQLVQKAKQSLEDAGLEPFLFDQVQADPPEAIIQAATHAAKSCAGVVGFGGGSSLDVAKLAALLAGNDQDLADVYGVGNATGARLPLILVPTTAGTGSEVTPISIVTTGTSEKMGVVSPLILPDIALLDPELTLGLPAAVTAATGIDAMVHAIEAYASASPNNNPISRALAVEALRLMAPALPIAVEEPDNMAARGDMLLGSMLAGQAFANSPVAAVHALAYPIGGHFKIPHGLSNALVLPHVLRFNIETAPEPYAALYSHIAPKNSIEQDPAQAFVDRLLYLSERVELPQRLRDLDIPRDALPMMARDAMNQTRLLVNNPREVSENDALSIYEAAW